MKMRQEDIMSKKNTKQQSKMIDNVQDQILLNQWAKDLEKERTKEKDEI